MIKKNNKYNDKYSKHYHNKQQRDQKKMNDLIDALSRRPNCILGNGFKERGETND